MPVMIAIFTDGACSGNPGPGGWGTIVAGADGRVLELGGGAPATTNNRMEMTAVLEGLRAAAGLPGVVVVHTDSTYVLGGITSWITGWKRRGWTTAAGEPVKNEDLWRALDLAVAARGKGGVEWRWVRGHDGHEANERCDAIAVAFSRRQPVELYAGPLLAYPHGSLAASEPQPLPEKKKPSARAKTDPRAGPASYLSLLDGKLERHATWKDCESRVKGRPAKFKKVRSPGEERETLKSWGLGE
ncbi:MAG: ribonuclease HI [Elusimicrobia bacterium]|nr:ribonuclease HI [Elusimicrobiota bacterium]